MKTDRSRLLALILGAVFLLGLPAAALADNHAKPGLFVNLTTDDPWSAKKAVMFAHKKVLEAGHKPVAIWLNIRAIHLADRDRAMNVDGADVQAIQSMLQAFVKDGGQVIACQACVKRVGLTQAKLADGIEMGNPQLVRGLLFNPKVKTLSW